MNLTRNQVDTLVRTSALNVTNKARLETYQKNRDVVKGIIHLSTLDDRTSEICQARSGTVYEINEEGEYIAVGHGFSFDGGPPYHGRCRSATAPVTRSFSELNRSKDPRVIRKLKDFKPTASTRASMDGQVPETTTFAGFAKRKGDGFIKDVLPPGKAALVIEGKITMRDLIDKHGKVRTLKQLKALPTNRRFDTGLSIPSIRSKT